MKRPLSRAIEYPRQRTISTNGREHFYKYQFKYVRVTLKKTCRLTFEIVKSILIDADVKFGKQKSAKTALPRDILFVR